MDSAIKKITAFISDLQRGEFSAPLTVESQSGFAPMVEQLNKLAATLAEQAKEVEKDKRQAEINSDVAFVIQSLGIGIWKWDLVTNALEWGEAMYSLYGCGPSEFSGAYEAWESSLSAETKA